MSAKDEELRREIEQLYAGYEIGFQQGPAKGSVMCKSCDATFLQAERDGEAQCYLRIDSTSQSSSIAGVYCPACGSDQTITPERGLAQHILKATVEPAGHTYQVQRMDEMVDWSGPKDGR